MAVSINVLPVSESLIMYGEPDTDSAYSISGHVSITISSSGWIFDRRYARRVLLHSLVLTFEGQTEVLTPKPRYSSVRICSITHEVVRGEAVELTKEGSEIHGQSCVWNVWFSFPVPGWLPETSTFGADNFGTRYTLFAEATYSDVDDTGFCGLATLYSPFRSRSRVVCTQKSISLRRLFLRDSNSTRTFRVSLPNADPRASDLPRIPAEILSKIQILASVPLYVSVDENQLALTIRMRTKNLRAKKCKRIQVNAIAANIIQIEKYRTQPSSQYAGSYPLPPLTQQPPKLPLRDPHPYSKVFDLGFCGPETNKSASRIFSLLPSGEYEPHTLGDDNYPFRNDADETITPTWYTLDTTVSFLHLSQDKNAELSRGWAGAPSLRVSMLSPLITVRHELHIHLMFSYHMPDSRVVAKELLSSIIPIQFVRFAQDSHCATYSALPAPASLDSTPSSSFLSPSSLHNQNLPPYSQLFDENGDRRIDYSVPLPLYTLHSGDCPPPFDFKFDWRT